MIHPVNAYYQPTFREGSPLATCTQKIRDLIARIQEFFLKIFQTILPCAFRKPIEIAPERVSPPLAQPVQMQILQNPPLVVLPPENRIQVLQVAPEPLPEPAPLAQQQQLPQEVVEDFQPVPFIQDQPAEEAEEEVQFGDDSPDLAAWINTGGPDDEFLLYSDDDDVKDEVYFPPIPQVRDRAAQEMLEKLEAESLLYNGANPGKVVQSLQPLGRNGIRPAAFVCLQALLKAMAPTFKIDLVGSEDLDRVITAGLTRHDAADLPEDDSTQLMPIIQSYDSFDAIPQDLTALKTNDYAQLIRRIFSDLKNNADNQPVGGFLLQGTVEDPEIYLFFLHYEAEENRYDFCLLDPYGYGADGRLSFHRFENPKHLANYLDKFVLAHLSDQEKLLSCGFIALAKK